MLAPATMLVVIAVALLVGRIATVAPTLTGLSREAARFQARSAHHLRGGVGRDAPRPAPHRHAPDADRQRRRRDRDATLMLSFGGAGEREVGVRPVLLVAALVVLLVVARSSVVDRALSRVIEKALARWATVEVADDAAPAGRRVTALVGEEEQ